MGAVVSAKNQYDNIDELKNNQNRLRNEEQRMYILSQIKKQEEEYKSKYDETILALNDPKYLHTDIVFDIYIKSIRTRTEKVKLCNKGFYSIEQDFLYIGKENFNDYFYSLKQRDEIDFINNPRILNKNEFISCQKIIYVEVNLNERLNNFELYILYFMTKIVYLIFLTKGGEISCYYKIYDFYLDTQDKIAVDEEITRSYNKFYIYYTKKSILLTEFTQEHYLKSIKKNIADRFKVIDLLDIDGFYTINNNSFDSELIDLELLNSENRLIKNPIIEFHLMIEKQIKKLKKLK
jgi:hypothetical protein